MFVLQSLALSRDNVNDKSYWDIWVIVQLSLENLQGLQFQSSLAGLCKHCEWGKKDVSNILLEFLLLKLVAFAS